MTDVRKILLDSMMAALPPSTGPSPNQDMVTQIGGQVNAAIVDEFLRVLNDAKLKVVPKAGPSDCLLDEEGVQLERGLIDALEKLLDEFWIPQGRLPEGYTVIDIASVLVAADPVRGECRNRDHYELRA